MSGESQAVHFCAKCGLEKLYPKEFCSGKNHRLCKECFNGYSIRRYAANIERSREATNAYAEKYREQNREAINARTREARRLRYKTDPEYVATTKAYKMNRAQRMQGRTDFMVTATFILQLMEAQDGICANPVCGTGIRLKYHIDHIMPLVLDGPHQPHNIQLLCPTCNVRKQAKHPATWLRSLGLTPTPQMLIGPVITPRPRGPKTFSPAFMAAEAIRKAADTEPGKRTCNECSAEKWFPEDFCTSHNRRICKECKNKYHRKYMETHIRKDRRK